MTKSEFSELLAIHQQWFPMSCAASGMEMLLKWHGMKPTNWFGFQAIFQNQNIGWEKRGDLAQFGIQAENARYDWSEFQMKFRSQVTLGRILLFSLPTAAYMNTLSGEWKGYCDYHVFLAAEVEGKDAFVSKAFLQTEQLDIHNLKMTYDLIRKIDPNYTIDVLSYDI